MSKILLPVIKHVFYELVEPRQTVVDKRWYIWTKANGSKALTQNLEIEDVSNIQGQIPDRFYFDDAGEAITFAQQYYAKHGYSWRDYPWVLYASNVITMEHYYKICPSAKGTVEETVEETVLQSEVMEF